MGDRAYWYIRHVDEGSVCMTSTGHITEAQGPLKRGVAYQVVHYLSRKWAVQDRGALTEFMTPLAASKFRIVKVTRRVRR